MRIFLVLLICLILPLISTPVMAQEGVSDGDPCSTAGHFQRKNNAEGIEFMICSGTEWKRVAFHGVAGEKVAFGAGAADETTTAPRFIAIGNNALGSLTSNVGAIAIGREALANFTEISVPGGGRSNLAIGNFALASVTEGSRNTALGRQAGNSITTGRNNTLIGDAVGQFAWNASDNTIVGSYAFYPPGTGGSHNVVVGTNGLSGNNGSSNVAIGHAAGTSSGTADASVFIGRNAGSSIDSGDNNIFIGHQAGDSTTTGGENILLGFDVDATAPGASNELNIGNTIFGDMTNSAEDGTGTARIGINEPTPGAELHVSGDIHFTGTLTDVSDRRKKRNIRKLTDALDKLRMIDGVSFVDKGKPNAARTLGLIAQDVQTVYPEAVKQLDDDTLALNYQGMIGPLVEAVKELDAENKSLHAENTAQNAEISELRRIIHSLSRRMDVIEGKVRPPMKPYNQ